jgi:hypothetical protein
LKVIAVEIKFMEMKEQGLLKCENCRYHLAGDCHLNPPCLVVIDNKLVWAFPRTTELEAAWCSQLRPIKTT